MDFSRPTPNHRIVEGSFSLDDPARLADWLLKAEPGEHFPVPPSVVDPQNTRWILDAQIRRRHSSYRIYLTQFPTLSFIVKVVLYNDKIRVPWRKKKASGL